MGFSTSWKTKQDLADYSIISNNTNLIVYCIEKCQVEYF